MNVFDLAVRNVMRNRRRTLITLAAIGVAACAIVILGGYVSATIKGLQTMTVRNVGHLQIMTEDYLAFGRAAPDRHAIRDYPALIERLESDPELSPMLRVVTPVLQVQGVAGHFASGNSSTFAAVGWQPAARDQMMSWNGLNQNVVAERGSLREDRPDEGVIGVGLAQLLDLCDALGIVDCTRQDNAVTEDAPEIAADLAALGQRTRRASEVEASPQDSGVAIELLAASSGGAPNVVRMQVSRAERQGVRELDLMHVALPLVLAQRLVFGHDEGAASALVVQLHEPGQFEAARARIAYVIGQWQGQALEVRGFDEVQPSYAQIVGMFNTLFGFVALLMIVVTLFSVANTVNMAVSERTGEIGTLRAIGLRRRDIRRMFVVEGGVLGLLGGALGVVAAVVLSVWGINRAGLSWTPPSNTVAVPIGIDIAGSVTLCLSTIGLMALIACVSSWWPARRAACMQVVEALRHV